MNRNRLHLALLLSSLMGVAAVVSTACGGIADPTKGGDGRIATVSGALTGVAVPANARVALVYRKITTTPAGTQGTVEVGNDVAVVGGKFTMNVSIPADDYFTSTDVVSIGGGSSSAPPSATVSDSSGSGAGGGTPTGSSTSGSPGTSGAFAARLAPRDIVGGQITQPLSAAVAGFVVYADTNGNGKLDLEGTYASSTDEILGGNKELMLVYLKGGGSLDYEKLRDKSGILPTAGFDLAWTEGRWLPLNDVELKLSASTQLPSSVCQHWISGGDSTSSSDPSVTATADASIGSGSSGGSSGGSSSGSVGSGYPSPSDPQLKCGPDGRSYTYGDSPTTCTTPPAPAGLCTGDVYPTTYCTGSTGYGNAIPADAPVPEGWPCPTTPTFDGGSGPDGSTVDGGSADGGSVDGGSADAG